MYKRNEQFLIASRKNYVCSSGAKYRNPCVYKHSCNNKCEYDVCPDRNTPKTIIDVLCSMINEQIQVTTPFGVITGTLLDVKQNYIVILEDTGAQVLVRTAKIESVSPIT
ncbi:MAG TPA: DUF2642 domain-containing protein [Bacillota bacterium]|nr:DUF2642 domain-containing protein [Bacillota bacterium]